MTIQKETKGAILCRFLDKSTLIRNYSSIDLLFYEYGRWCIFTV